MSRFSLRFLSGLFLLSVFGSPLFGQYVVTTTADVSPIGPVGSLRAAIVARNSCSTVCPAITFNIPNTDPGCVSGTCTITLVDTLPAINAAISPVAINGQSQVTFNGFNILINGNGVAGDGILAISPVNLSGFYIGGFPSGAAVRLGSNADTSSITALSIGFNAGGTAFPNQNGITIETGYSSAAISAAVRNSALAGIRVGASPTDTTIGRVRLYGLSLQDNGGLGIDLGNDGVTANDANDADTGVNNLQNFPVITSAAETSMGGVRVTGTFNIDDLSSDYDLEIYGTFAADPEAASSLGVFTFPSTGLTGNTVAFDTGSAISAWSPSLTHVTATLTKRNFSLSLHETSEISAAAVVVRADLSITKTGPTNVVAGRAISWNLNVKNLSPEVAATNVTVTDTLPAGVTGVSGTGAGWTCGVAGSIVTCTAASLPISYDGNITISGNAPVGPATITNTASIAASTGNNDPANDTSTFTTTLDYPDLTVTKTAGSPTVAPGANVTYTVTVTNGGVAGADGVQLVDTLPASFTFVSTSGAGWSCSPVSNVVTCTRTAGELPASASSVLTLVATAASTPGTYTNTVNVSASNETNGANNSASVNVNVVNGAPVANADSYAGTEDVVMNVAAPGVLANDTDPEGNPLSATLMSGPASGTLTLNANGSFTYTPNANFNGSDSFTYEVSDGTNVAGPATVTLTIAAVNDAPVANADSTSTTAPTPVTINVLSNDTDVDGNTLTVTSWTNGANGTVSCTPAGACTYTPTGAPGSDAFTYTISDGNGGTATGTVTVAVSTAPGADLSLLKEGPSEAPTGEMGTYTFTIINGGPQPATSILLTDPLPLGMAYLGTTSTEWTCTLLDGTLKCSLPSLGVGAMSTLSIQVQMPSSAGRIFNEAWVESSLPDPATANNMSGVETLVFEACGSTGALLLAPTEGARVTSPVSFSWTTVAGAARYRLTIVSPSGTTEQVLDASATSASAAIGPGPVSWTVTAEFTDGCPPLSTAGNFTVCPNGVPVATGPTGPVTTQQTTLTWTPVAGAERYDVFVSTNGGAFALAGSVAGTDASPSLLINLVAGSTVNWYVDAIFTTGCASTRSATAGFNASCFPPELSLQGEVTSGKPYEVRASIVSVGANYLFEESTTEDFRAITASRQGSVDETNSFIVAVFEHTVDQATPFYYRTRVEQAGCLFSPPGRIVVIPLPPPTSSDTETVVQFGREEQVRQDLFVGSPTPTQQISYTFVATTDREWMRVEPAAGTIGPAGVTLTVITDPVGLPVGTNTGTVTVTFTAVGGGGKSALETTPITGSTPVSVTLVNPVANKGKDSPSALSLIIPAVAHAAGVNSEWQTDVRLFNMGMEKQKYRLLWTSTGTDATLSGKSSEIELAPGQISALNDLVKQWYGLGSIPGENATGVLEIRPESPGGAGKGALAIPPTRTLVSLASSRTYNRTPNGTLGEYIPAIPFASFVGGTPNPGEKKSVLSLQQLSQSSAYRTNIGVTEASGNPVSVEMRFFNADGAKILTVPLALRSGEHRQLNQVLAANGLTNVTTARAEVEVMSGDGRITAYASVVDNVTGDPLQVHAVDLAKIGATKYVLPGIAHFNTGQARWRTDVQMFNAGAAAVNATVSFFPVGASAAARTTSVTIDPGKLRTLADILPTLFGQSNTGGAIQISTGASSQLVITGRTYDQREEGSYGQFMAAVTEDDAIGLGDRAVQVLQMEQSSNIRSNLGIVEITGKEVRVELSAFPAESRVTPRIELTLKPNEFRQINAVLKALNAGTTYNARIALRVVGGDGKIVAYGSAVDNLTQDPTYIPGQ